MGEAYVAAGADVVEIGVPFSDPLADGPTIQDTTTLAIENGADLNYCLDLASTFSDRVPVVFLLYYNVIFARGIEEFVREAAAAGVSGLVVPDLPVDEAGEFARLSSEAGVAFCPLVAPTSTDERLARVGELASGFVYCVSVAGVTGVRDALPSGAVELLRRARAKTDAPVALGFGIGSPEAAVEAAGEADGVIIGSKLMRLVGEGGPERPGVAEVREALSGVVRSGGAIRNWLSKRREYTRSAPRPRVGSARSTTPASPSASGAGSRSTRRISSPGSTSVPTASSTTPARAGADPASHRRWELRGARPGHGGRGSSGVRGLRGEARAREKEHGSRRRRVERGRKDRGPAGGARGHGLPVYRGSMGSVVGERVADHRASLRRRAAASGRLGVGEPGCSKASIPSCSSRRRASRSRGTWTARCLTSRS